MAIGNGLAGSGFEDSIGDAGAGEPAGDEFTGEASGDGLTGEANGDGLVNDPAGDGVAGDPVGDTADCTGLAVSAGAVLATDCGTGASAAGREASTEVREAAFGAEKAALDDGAPAVAAARACAEVKAAARRGRSVTARVGPL